MPDSLIEKVSQEGRVFEVAETARLKPEFSSLEDFKRKYEFSINNPEKFWGDEADSFFWFEKWKNILRYDWKDKIETFWFEGAKTNLAYNCLDRHLKEKADQLALLWEGNDPRENRKFTYRELHAEVGKVANSLKSLGVQKGDRVAIYMGMVPELAMALLACARIGAVHNVVFGGFSEDSLKERILDCRADYLLTADGLFRGPKEVMLKGIADRAMQLCADQGHIVRRCLVLRRTAQSVEMKEGRDLWWHDVVPSRSPDCPAEILDAEDPLFILYTSGSTGKPKGLLHTTAGYMVYTASTFRHAFCYQPGDLFWCTADIGWITGHSYLVYGPLLNAASVMMFEGVPTSPNPDRYWDIIERHGVNILYTSPTAIRSLMRENLAWVRKHDLSSLKLLGTVGEPINPQSWVWYFENIGGSRCPIVDTWWQTETGGIMMTTPPGLKMKPGFAGLPFLGIKPQALRESGEVCSANQGGYFVLETPWPGIARSIYDQPERMKETYFSKFPGYYLAGDGAYHDEEGYWRFAGRVDDVLKVSGHRLGTAELESAFVKHPKVVEAAVVGFPHPIKGEGIYAFLTLKEGVAPDRGLRREIIQHIAQEIGPIAKPDHILFAPALPKTRSGKIMRRLLRKIASGETTNLGDTSTLADPGVVDQLIESLTVKEAD